MPVTIASTSRVWNKTTTTDWWVAKSTFVVGSNIYVVTQDTGASPKIRIRKSALSFSLAFTEQDSVNAQAVFSATQPFSAFATATHIHVVYFSAVNTLTHKRFDISTNLWTTGFGNVSIDVWNASHVRVMVRPNNDVVVFFSSLADSADPLWARYQGVSWTTSYFANFTDAGTAAIIDGVEFDGSSYSNAFYIDPGGDDLRWNTISGTNSQSAAVTLDSTIVTTDAARFGGNFDPYDVNGTKYITAAWLDADSTIETCTVQLGIVAILSGLGTQQQASSTIANTGVNTVLATAYLNDVRYLIWQDDQSTSSFLYVTAPTDGTWDTTPIVWKSVTGTTLASATSMVAQAIAIPNYGILVTYQDGTDVKVEYLIVGERRLITNKIGIKAFVERTLASNTIGIREFAERTLTANNVGIQTLNTRTVTSVLGVATTSAPLERTLTSNKAGVQTLSERILTTNNVGIQTLGERTLIANDIGIQSLLERTLTSNKVGISALIERTLVSNKIGIQSLLECTLATNKVGIQSLKERSLTSNKVGISALSTRTLTTNKIGIQTLTVRTVSSFIGIRAVVERTVTSSIALQRIAERGILNPVIGVQTLKERTLTANKIGLQSSIERTLTTNKIGIAQLFERTLTSNKIGIQGVVVRTITSVVGIATTSPTFDRTVISFIGIRTLVERSITSNKVGIQSLKERSISSAIGIRTLRERSVTNVVGIQRVLERTVSSSIGIRTLRERTVTSVLGVTLNVSGLRTVTSVLGVRAYQERIVTSVVGVRALRERVISSSASIATMRERSVATFLGVAATGTRSITASVGIRRYNERSVISVLGLRALREKTVLSQVSIARIGERSIVSFLSVNTSGVRTIISTIGLRRLSERSITSSIAVTFAISGGIDFIVPRRGTLFDVVSREPIMVVERVRNATFTVDNRDSDFVVSGSRRGDFIVREH